MRKWILLLLALGVGCTDTSPTAPTAQLTGTWLGSGDLSFEANLHQEGTDVAGEGGGLLPPDSAALPLPFTVSGSIQFPLVQLAFVTSLESGQETLEFDGTFVDANTVEGRLRDLSLGATYVIEMHRSAARVGSGIEGVVTLGPLCPVQGVPECPDASAPYVATLVVRDESGAEVGRVTSGPDGRYAIAVQPGTYRVEGRSDAPPYRFPLAPVADGVVVHSQRWTWLDLEYDTGIR